MADCPKLDTMEVVHAFGLNHSIRDTVIGLDMGAHVLSVVGNRLAVMSTEPNDDMVAHMQGAGGEENTTGPSARFLPHLPHVVRVTAVAVDDRRRTLAVCVEAKLDADEADVLQQAAADGSASLASIKGGVAEEDGAQDVVGDGKKMVNEVVIYNLVTKPGALPKKVRTLVQEREHAIGLHEHAPFVAAAFSMDGQNLLAISGFPICTVVAWDWKKSQIMFTSDMKHSVTKISFHPTEASMYSTSGPDHLQMWRISNKQLRQAPQVKGLLHGEAYTDHCWTHDDRLVTCTQSGSVVVVEENEQQQVFKNAHQQHRP
eukprot:CAMPEP_0119503216 /NCGR_PEP_ID=MMETSP1344-20130328/24460_1 /TAXON_ID=236787 /ORGANISM="Florenciella parvula, Strain CCMP2471" /LENGTH=315 /DNA_ID=CAMNT_0007539489 /DNA_START=129 /DNA_END=1072 /DNA_ORIENTATION=+